MLKLALPILLLAGITPEASEDVEIRSDAMPSESNDLAPSGEGHDRACANDPALAQGVEGEARLYRDPADPDSLQPVYAVDYAVNGCGLLVMTDGTLVQPPRQDEPQPVTLQPAQ